MLCFNSFTVEAQESWTPTSGDQIGKDTNPTANMWMRLTGGWGYESNTLKPSVRSYVSTDKLAEGDYVLVNPSKDGTLTIKGIKGIKYNDKDGNKYLVIQTGINTFVTNAKVVLGGSSASYKSDKLGYQLTETSNPTEFTAKFAVKAGTYYCIFISDFDKWKYTGYTFEPSQSSYLTTTIASSKTISTSDDASWDFSNTNPKWAESVSQMQAVTKEWSHDVSSGKDEYRPTTAPNFTEYIMPIVRGLRFKIANNWGLCIDYKTQAIWMQKNGIIVIPGLKAGQLVSFGTSGTISPVSDNVMKAGVLNKVVSDGDGQFRINSDGAHIASISVYKSTSSDGNKWDFTKWSDNTLNGLSYASNEWNKTSRYFENKVIFTGNSYSFTEIKDLKFVTEHTQDIRLNYKDGYMYVRSNEDYITIPSVEQGQIVSIVSETGNDNEARGIAITSGNASRIGGAEFSADRVVNMFTVTSTGPVTFRPTRGAVRLYSITITGMKQATSLKIYKDGKDVTNSEIIIPFSNPGDQPVYVLSNGDNSKITFESNNDKVIVDQNGYLSWASGVQIYPGEKATITATYPGNDTYSSSSAYFTSVLKIRPEMYFSSTEVTGVMGTGLKEPELYISLSGIKPVYKSTNESVATVDPVTGEVNMLKVGETNIVAVYDGDDYYVDNFTYYTLKVTAPTTSNTATWKIDPSNGNKFSFVTPGKIIGGFEIHDVPGMVATFGAVGTEWHVSYRNDEKGFHYGTKDDQVGASMVNAQGVAQPVSLNADGIPTGGSYVVFKPIVNGILFVDTRYYQGDTYKLVDRDTKQVINSYTSSAPMESGNHKFMVPLKAGQRYYFYNSGNGKANSKTGLDLHGFLFAPVFLQSVGNNLWPADGSTIKGVEVYNNASNVPTMFDGEHPDVSYGSYSSDKIAIDASTGAMDFKQETGRTTVWGKVTHTASDGNVYESMATANITYEKSAFKFMQTEASVALNEGDLFVEPKLNYDIAGVTYSSSSTWIATVNDKDGNITPKNVGTTTITANANDSKFFKGTASYALTVDKAAPRFEVISSEIELPVGTAGWNVVANNINVENANSILDKGGASYSYVMSKNGPQTVAADFYSFESSDQTVASVNKNGGIDTRLPGICTITVRLDKAKDMSTATRTFKVIVPLIQYDLDHITYKSWNFTGGFTADDLNKLRNRGWKDNADGSLTFKADASNTTSMGEGYHEIPTSLTDDLYFQPFNTKSGKYGQLTFNKPSSFDAGFGKYRISLDQPNTTFIEIRDVLYGQAVAIITDNHGMKGKEGDWLQTASDSHGTQPADEIFPKNYTDPKDPDGTKYQHNRCTNVFLSKTEADSQPNLGVEADNAAVSIRSIIQGSPAAYGFLNVGAGKASADNAPTTGYATVCSRLNISLEGQTAVKAYICDYYGYKNNMIHLQQIKNIPANTAVLLKGYARDIYCLYANAKNGAVDAGVDDEVLASNKFIPCIYDEQVEPIQTINGEKYHVFGLSGDAFYRLSSPGTVAGGRCYLRLNEEEYNDLVRDYEPDGSTNFAKKMTIVFEDLPFDEEETTGIVEVDTNTEDEGTSDQDGYYTLNGIKISKPTKAGIYIHNGKKYIVK